METPMANFILLAKFTEQGITNAKQTVERAESSMQMAGKLGVKIMDFYWTLGSRDVIAICEAPDDESATAFSLSLASLGNVSTETLRAFSLDEMKQVLAKMV